jgi:hypothetical protein
MMNTRLLLALLLVFISAPLTAFAADWEGVFAGTIGKTKVLVELNASEEKSDYKGGYLEGSRYSYLPKVRDINLILDKEAETLSFTETLHLHRMYADEADKKITGRWTLTVSGGTASGTWTSPDGAKTLPISLKREKLVDVSENTNQLSATYDAMWLKEITLTDAGLFKNFGAVEVRKLKDSAFGIEHPTFAAFPDEQRKRAINAALEAAFRSEISEYRECQNGVPIGWEEEGESEGPDITFEVHYASPTLLSFTATGSVYCGGAHPSNFVTPITFDVTTAEQIGGTFGENRSDLNAKSFGRILKLASKDERVAFERFALGRWKDANAKDKENAESCLNGWINDSPEGEKEFSLSFTSTGLAITRNDYPHVASVCLFTTFNPTIIPWTELKPWLRPDQTLLTTEIPK